MLKVFGVRGFVLATYIYFVAGVGHDPTTSGNPIFHHITSPDALFLLEKLRLICERTYQVAYMFENHLNNRSGTSNDLSKGE